MSSPWILELSSRRLGRNPEDTRLVDEPEPYADKALLYNNALPWSVKANGGRTAKY